MQNNELMDQLVDLQSRFAFQEDTIQALNTIVSEQQRELEMLTRLVTQLSDRLDSVAADVAQSSPFTPPPHY